VQGVHIGQKECIDRGDLTSEKLRRDSVEPSSAEVQGVHRKNSVLSSKRDRVNEHFVRGRSTRCASRKENARRVRRIYFQEILWI
jgi:hypothetical protein